MRIERNPPKRTWYQKLVLCVLWFGIPFLVIERLLGEGWMDSARTMIEIACSLAVRTVIQQWNRVSSIEIKNGVLTLGLLGPGAPLILIQDFSD